MSKMNRTLSCMLSVALLFGVATSCKKKHSYSEEPVVSQEQGGKTTDDPKDPNEENGKVVDDQTGAKVRSVTIDVTAYDKFVYFSFDKGLIPISDDQSRDNLDWDMAFHRADIRTNGGKSSDIGAQGAAVETSAMLLSDKVEIPADDKFESDVPYVVAVYHTDEEGVRQDYRPVSPVLTTLTKPVLNDKGEPVRGSNGFIQYKIHRKGAIAMDLSRMPPSMELSKKVYIIRTPKGTYGKVRVINYRRKPGTPMGDPGRLLTMEYVYPIKRS